MHHQLSDREHHCIELLQGECKLTNAPLVQFDNGQTCIPQHYLKFSHTRESVEKIVFDIDYNILFPIFVSEEEQQIYLQIGIVGQDNYASTENAQNTKIVYGRKWRVEPNLPTSEIIQSVFLALIIAREHEVRELFRVNHQGALTTPFNNHHDLPALAHLRAEFSEQNNQQANKAQLKQLLLDLSYDGAPLKLLHLEQLHNQQWLLEIHIESRAQSSLQELQSPRGIELVFLLKDCSINTLLHELMAQLLMLSHRHIEEHFCYKGFKRFSRTNAVLTLSKLSAKMRRKTEIHAHEEFVEAVVSSNYNTDKSRIPQQQSGPLAEKIARNLAQYPIIDGILPNVILCCNG